jgi:hypothetical protein
METGNVVAVRGDNINKKAPTERSGLFKTDWYQLYSWSEREDSPTHYVTGIPPAPASAPLRLLSQPSVAAFPTLSRRSLRFESFWLKRKTKGTSHMGSALIVFGRSERIRPLRRRLPCACCRSRPWLLFRH